MTLARSIRQVLTIARRDFTAAVFTPIFLIFLFAPVLMGVFGGLVGGLGAASVAAPGAGDTARVVAIVPHDQMKPLTQADARLRAVFRPDEGPPPLLTLIPAADPAAQANRAFHARDYAPAAVLYGPIDRPMILYGPHGDRAADYLEVLAGATLAAEQSVGAAAVHATKRARAQGATGGSGEHGAAFFATFGIFFLTLFLAGQVVASIAEERNNKVIEVLAAAVPLESVFFGKLLGMLGTALLFIAFWGTVVAELGTLLPPQIAAALPNLHPAVGLPAFPILFVLYFTMAYLLLGAVFLGVGAQASSPREIQMLSLPITFVQIGIFALASAAARAPGTSLARGAELFPLSSPFAMAGRAANLPGLWPHVAALAWQSLWVAIFVTIGARAFRRGVLQSGTARANWRARLASRRKPIDMGVS